MKCNYCGDDVRVEHDEVSLVWCSVECYEKDPESHD